MPQTQMEEEERCPANSDGEHELAPKDGSATPKLYYDTLCGWGAEVRCRHCNKTGFVRLDFDDVNWD